MDSEDFFNFSGLLRKHELYYLKTLSYFIIAQNYLVLQESPLPSMMAQEVLKQLFADRAKLFNQVSKYLLLM